MRSTICAILAAVMGLSPLVAADVLDQPVRVVFRLADNVRIDGRLTEWDRDGFDGSFGRRYWIELRTDDAWRLFRRLMNDESVDDWLNIGRMMLMHGEGGVGDVRHAEFAFRRAREIDPSVEPRIEAIREEIASAREALNEKREARRSGELRTQTPEAREWSDAPWPEVVPAQQDSARLTLFADAEAMLAELNLSIEPVESDFFIVYSDAERRDAAEWAVALDAWYREIAQLLTADETHNIFWGKAVVIILEDADAFRLIEKNEFAQLLPRTQMAVTHYRGPKVFINAVRRKDELLLREALARETVHAFLHRFQTPLRLPPWAHEGLAEYFAQKVLDASPIHEGIRRQALQLVRGNFPVAGILTIRYEDDAFPGRNREVPALGYLMVEFLLKRGPDRFAEWVKAVKAGLDWRESLESIYAGSIDQFIGSFVQFYRVND